MGGKKKKNQIKRKDKQIFGSCQRTEKVAEHEEMVIPIIVRALGRVFKGRKKRLLELEIKRRIETIQTTAVLRSARILRTF